MPEMINPLAAFREGYATVQGFRDDYAKRQAGNALAGGDYRGGANALLQNGMLSAGMDVQQAGQERDQAAQTKAKAKQTETLAAVLDGAKALRQVPMEQRAAFLQSRVLPLLQQRGATGGLLQQISGLSGEDLSDQSLDGFATSLGGAMQQTQFQLVNNAEVGAGSFDPRTGGINIQYAPQPKPLVVPEGTTVLDIRTQNQPQINESSARGLVASVLPGAVVTSGTRTPERNAAVGGVPNSYHLRGQALDIKPPQGVSIEQFRQTLEARGMPVAELIDEGDHWHLAWGAKAGQGAPRVLAQGAPKPRARPATPQEKAAYGIPANSPAMIKPDGSIEIIQSPAGKPLPVALQNAEDKDYEKIDGHEVIADQLGGFVNQIQSGKLKLGPVANRLAEARTYAGWASQEDANYNSFVSGMKKMRDDSLALANGTQTEGDAQRAWEQLFANMNDERVVTQRLKEIQAVNARAVKFRQDQIDRRRVRNGAEPVFGTVQAPSTKTTRPPEKDPLGLFQK